MGAVPVLAVIVSPSKFANWNVPLAAVNVTCSFGPAGFVSGSLTEIALNSVGENTSGVFSMSR